MALNNHGLIVKKTFFLDIFKVYFTLIKKGKN